MKQTAVEWFIELFKDEPRFLNEFALEINHAKKLEKQQIIDAIAESNKSNNRNVSLNPKQYYNETFKNKQEL